MEGFIYGFSVYGKNFKEYLENSSNVLKSCQETHFDLNWEKCHFMIREETILGQ